MEINIIAGALGLCLGIILGWLLRTVSAVRKESALRGELEAFRTGQEKLEAERRAALERERQEMRSQWELRFEKMKEEIVGLSRAQLSERQDSLRDTNRRQMEELLQPVKEQFEAFRQEVARNRTSGEVAKEEIKRSFESALKLFGMQQQTSMESLREHTRRISEDAQSLTRVLRHDSKVQGDWGEMILETLLESSGLIKGEHYFIQENVKDESGKNFRPDVIVRFPEGRSVIIDSKVSITAYADAFDTEDEAMRKQKLREHARSVRRHIDELAAKKYDTMVTDSIGLVLMFIPNDQSYIMAIEHDRELPSYAYGKGIVIISPSNLMIALQLAYNMWQQDRQNKNVEKIVSTAADLYDKVASFSETLEDVSLHISRLGASFEKVRSQLYDGKGNIMRRVDNLRNLGVTPRKKIRRLED